MQKRSIALSLFSLLALAPACSGDDELALDPDAAAGPDAGPDAPPAGARAVRLADRVIAAPGASGSGFGDPQRAVNGVKGGGLTNGSVDVYSLNLPPAQNTSITLGWSGGRRRR